MEQNSNNKNIINKERHEFAFFIENLWAILSKNFSLNKDFNIDLIQNIENNKMEPNKIFSIESEELFHRLSHVVRLKNGDVFTLFDQNLNVELELTVLSKKKITTAKLITINLNPEIKPKINFLLPILKRENLETALYSCCELGANEIILIETEKSQKNFNSNRATKILISAAEQSKNFNFSKIHLPTNLEKYINSNKEQAINIFFDSEGENLDEVVMVIRDKLPKKDILNLMIGPEGDLTENEKILLKKHDFIFCKLTPTILRSCQAVGIGLGVFRSLFNKQYNLKII